MTLAQSKVTAQGQISVPAEVRRRLGLWPRLGLEWVEDGGQVLIRRAGRYSSLRRASRTVPFGSAPGEVGGRLKEGYSKIGTVPSCAPLTPTCWSRLVTRDDDAQTAAAEAFVAKGAWVSHLVLAETMWVLDAVLGFSRGQIAMAVDMLLAAHPSDDAGCRGGVQCSCAVSQSDESELLRLHDP